MAKKFLDDVELGSEAIRAAVVEFMPYSFAAVNAQSKRFLEVRLTAHCLSRSSSSLSAAPCRIILLQWLLSLFDTMTCLCQC